MLITKHLSISAVDQLDKDEAKRYGEHENMCQIEIEDNYLLHVAILLQVGQRRVNVYHW